MKFITNYRRECGDLIMLPQRHEIATLLCSSQRMCRNEADVVRSARPLGVKMQTFNIDWATNTVVFMDSAKLCYQVDIIEYKIRCRQFYE